MDMIMSLRMVLWIIFITLYLVRFFITSLPNTHSHHNHHFLTLALAGTISAPWKFDSGDTGYAKYNATSGHARVQVTPQDMTVEFVSVENKVIYSYNVKAKHTASSANSV
mgnify:CR=1 FL=1